MGEGHGQEPPRTLLGEGERPLPFPWRAPALSHLTPDQAQRLLGAHGLCLRKAADKGDLGSASPAGVQTRTPSALAKE